jgi:uncharacterized protein (TIGR04255 family)
VLVLAVVKFAPLPLNKFEEAVLQLHDLIRKEYPGIEKGKDSSVQVIFNEQDNKIQQDINEEPFFIFSSADSAWLIKINTTSFAIFTRNYLSFEDLLNRLLDILSKLIHKIGITHTANIGLRYINRIDIKDERDFDNAIVNGFLQPKIVGFKAMAGSDMINVYQADTGWCFVRTSLRIQGSDIPNELLPIAHKMRLAAESVNNVFAAVDIDTNTMSHDFVEFDLEGVKNRLTELHSLAKIAFGSVLTEAEIQRRS